jgi:hypothetical protein
VDVGTAEAAEIDLAVDEVMVEVIAVAGRVKAMDDHHALAQAKARRIADHKLALSRIWIFTTLLHGNMKGDFLLLQFIVNCNNTAITGIYSLCPLNFRFNLRMSIL